MVRKGIGGNDFFFKSLLETYFVHSRKASIDPLTPFLHVSFQHHNLLHWFALQCSQQATTCESNYSLGGRLEERKGGIGRGIEKSEGTRSWKPVAPGCV